MLSESQIFFFATVLNFETMTEEYEPTGFRISWTKPK